MTCCKKCGTIKTVGAVYCPICGYKFPPVSVPVWRNNGNLDLVISNERITIESHNTELFDLVSDIGQDFVDSFNDLEDYLSHWGGYFDSVFESAIPYFLKSLANIVQYFYDWLIDNDVDCVNKNDFADAAVSSLDVESDLEILSDWAESISEQVNKLNSMRNAQRSTRGRWQGGGFGIKGAIKGAITAGVLNLGTDFVRGIGDSYIDSRDADKIKKLKVQTGRVVNPRLILSECYVKYYLRIMRLAIDVYIINDYGDSLNYSQKSAEAQTILNVTEDLRPKMIGDAEAISRYKEVMCGVIPMYPFDPTPYLNLIETAGCEPHEVEAAVEAVGIDAFFDTIVKLKVSEYSSRLQTIFSELSNLEKIDYVLRLKRLLFGCSCLNGNSRQVYYTYSEKLKEMGLLK